MREYLKSLENQVLSTVQGMPNQITEVTDRSVRIKTGTSPGDGSTESIAWIQESVDKVFDAGGEEVELQRNRRSAFVFAVLATMDEVEVLTDPRRARLARGKGQPSNWSQSEIEAAVTAYLDMLEKEIEGTPYIKSQVNLALRNGALKSRSKASVEMRMQNISSVMEQSGFPRIQGYVPLGNAGSSVGKAILEAIKVADPKFLSGALATDDPAELQERAEKLSRTDLEPPENPIPPEVTESVSKSYKRDPWLVAWILKNAKGICELCGDEGPFESKGAPFLEVHHVQPLGKGGLDSKDNAVAICPNCHRRCHLSDDSDVATQYLYDTVDRLIRR